MANSDKDIRITPNTGGANKPTIRFNGANNNPVNLYVQDSGALTIEGSAGQLFAITDSLSGTIFSVNDVAGIPSIDVQDTGDVRIAPYSGRVAVGKSSASFSLDVGGIVNANAFFQNGVPVGGWTQITSASFPTNVASISITSIPQNFRSLRLVMRNTFPSSNGAQFFIRFNGNANGSTYYNWPWSTGNNNNFSYNDTLMYVAGSTWSSNNFGMTTVDIDDYSNITSYKKAVSSSFHTSTSGESAAVGWTNVGWFRSTAGISSISIHTTSGNFSGGTYQLYGIR